MFPSAVERAFRTHQSTATATDLIDTNRNPPLIAQHDTACACLQRAPTSDVPHATLHTTYQKKGNRETGALAAGAGVGLGWRYGRMGP